MKKFNKRNFFLGHSKWRQAKIHIKKSFSNIFITLTDLNNLVIICFTSGSANPSFSKKKKISPYAVEYIAKKLLFYLKFYKIKALEIILKLRISAPVFFLLKELQYYGFSVSKIVERYSLPHNGVRERKAPRK
jgi:ribosomal protein S11